MIVLQTMVIFVSTAVRTVGIWLSHVKSGEWTRADT